jgi:hypothetical protein
MSGLCSITVGGSGMWTQKVGLDEERTRIVEEHEWNDFVEYWNDEMRRQRKWHVPSRERSAIKVFMAYNEWRLKQKVELTEKKTHDEFINEHSTIRVAQNGPIYGYSYLGSRVERAP